MKNPKSERATEAMYTPSGYYETYNGLSIEADRLDFLAKIEDPRVFHRVCTRLILSCNLRAKAYLRSGLSVEYQHNRQCADVLTKLLKEWEPGLEWERSRKEKKISPSASPSMPEET